MLMERGDAVKEVLSSLRGYLRDHLPVDVDFLSKLQGKYLLADENADQIRASVDTKGKKSGVDGLLDYMSSYYDEETLERFCVFLEEYSKPARPLLSKIAKIIREDLKLQQPPPTQPTVKDDDVPGPSGSAPEFHAKSFMDKYKERFLRCVHTLSIATRMKVHNVIPEALYHEIDRGKITASEASEKLFLHLQSHAVPDTIHHLCNVMAGQEDYPLMKKLGEDMKKDKDLPPSSTGPLPMESSTPHPSETTRDDVPGPSGTASEHPTNTPTLTDTSTPTTVTAPQNEDTRFYPVISQLEDDFAELSSAVLAHIKSLDEGKLGNLRSFLTMFLKPKHSASASPPTIPKSLDDLEFFLIHKWDELQIRVMSGVVNHLQVESLSTKMEAYKQKLADKIIAFLSCDKRIATYKQIPNHLLVDVTIDCYPEEISLKRILELKDYFIDKLGLGEALFQAYSTGSTVLYFSIPEDSVWCLPACLHPSNLPQLEEWKVVSLSVEGKFTIDLVEKRIVDVLDQQSLSKHLYMIDVLMNENFKLREKMAEMEKILRYYEEEDSGGRKVSRSVPRVKPDPMFEVESLESEPLTKKPKLEPPDYPDIKPKMETADPNLERGSDFEQSLSKHLYMNEVLMNEVTQLRVKMAEMERSLRYYEEEDSGGRKVSRSVPTGQDVTSPSAGPHRDVKGKGKMTRVSSPPVMPPAVLPTQHTPSLGLDLHSQLTLPTPPYPMEVFYQSRPQAMGPGPLQQMEPGPLQQMEPGTLQQMEPGPLQQMEPGPLQQMVPGPLHQMGPGPLQQMEPGPLQQMGPGPLQQMGPGPLQQMEPDQLQQMEPGQLQQMEPGPLQQMEPGPLQQMGPGPLQQMEPGPLQQMGLGPLQQMEPGPLQQMELGTHQPMGPDPLQQMGLGPLQPMGPGLHQQMEPGPSQPIGLGPLQQMGPDKLRLFEEEKLKLSNLYWREEPDVLEGMSWPTAVYLNGKIFVGERWSGYHQFLCVFNVVSRTWSKLPFHDSCKVSGFTLATSNSKVHAIGGTWIKDGKVERYSNKVFSLDDDLMWPWFNTLPPLNIGRRHATSTSFDSFILVAGGSGRNGGDLSSVEVLDSSQSSSTWWEICDLPLKSNLMQCTVTHDDLFIGCGSDTEYTIYTSKLSAVKESLNVDEDSESSVSPESFWQSLPKTPLRWSGLVSVNNCLLTVGGGLKSRSSVHLYDCYKKTWSKVSDIRNSRVYPAVVVNTFENKQELFVLGGFGANTSVESCELL